MSAICIRFNDTGLNDAESKDLHAEVAQRVERTAASGYPPPNSKAKPDFRINPVNFRTRQEHMEDYSIFFSKSVMRSCARRPRESCRGWVNGRAIRNLFYQGTLLWEMPMMSYEPTSGQRRRRPRETATSGLPVIRPLTLRFGRESNICVLASVIN